MSQASYGSFTVEEHVPRGGDGGKVRPWTDDDASRLAGTFSPAGAGGRFLVPHVQTPQGAVYIGRMAPPVLGSKCPRCGALKCHRPRLVRLDSFELFCFGCGQGNNA